MNSASKVAEIFESAGMAFSRLGAMTMELQQQSQSQSPTNVYNNDEGKWGENEIGMLRTAVRKFGNDIEKICMHMKSKSVSQIRSALKRKAVQQKVANTKAGASSSTTPTAIGLHQEISQGTPKTHVGQGVNDESGPNPAKRSKIDTRKDQGTINTEENIIYGKSELINNTSMVETALDKLRYDSKEPHEIDIEG